MHQRKTLHNENCRNQIYNGHEFLITEVGTSSEDKIRLGVNCDGYGRIRLFKRYKDIDWVSNPLPFNPYANAMGEDIVDELPVQVFQVAKCNMNCWWCFIPDEYKKLNNHHNKWFSVADLLELYIRDGKRYSKIIDLSGGNPELVPEFVLQFMMEIEKRNFNDEIYLWSDDVLTTDYLFTKLTSYQVDYMANYHKYGKVACFKGIDDASFCFNTSSPFSMLDEQFLHAKRYIDKGFDIYFYIVLTMPDLHCLQRKISIFIDKLQKITHYLPLRVVPIKIKQFDTNVHRFNDIRTNAINSQYEVLMAWQEELDKRFSTQEINMDISLIPIK